METLAMSWGIPLLVALLSLVMTGVVRRSWREAFVKVTKDPGRQLLRFRRTLTTLGINAYNTLVYVLSVGTHVPHQGRYSALLRKWVNWNRNVSWRPREYYEPADRAGLQALLSDAARRSKRVRLVGSGHSFNAAPTTDGVQISLDRYRLANGEWLEWVDEKYGIVRVAAGMKLRKLTRDLWEKGWALPVLGSADAQSLAGLLTTDVHGTGRDHGFLSEQVRALTLMDAQGNILTVRNDSTASVMEREIFQASLGGLGACGVLLEVELKCVPRFTLEKSSWLMRREWVERNLGKLLREHTHVSFYELGGADNEHIRMNVWKPSGRAPSGLLWLRRIISETLDMLVSGFLLELASVAACQTRSITNFSLFAFKLLMDGKHTVQPASKGFSRTLYFHHDELEYGVPYLRYRSCIKQLRALLAREKFLCIVEVRFTPPSRSPALLGPGAGNQWTCFIELAPTLSYGPERIGKIFAEATKIFLAHGGRPHLGKQLPEVDPGQLKRVHGPRFTRFVQARELMDPSPRRFTNDFTERVFGP